MHRLPVEALLGSGHLCSVATHDPDLLEYAHAFVEDHGLNAGLVEFELPYGVTLEHLRKMGWRGYSTRVYLVYGEEWCLYLCHRLAEHPPNIYLAVAGAAGANTSARTFNGGDQT